MKGGNESHGFTSSRKYQNWESGEYSDLKTKGTFFAFKTPFVGLLLCGFLVLVVGLVFFCFVFLMD